MKKVLIVEDDLMIADCLEEILVDAGYSVCGIANDIEGAIKIGEETNPDLAIIDFLLADGRLGTEVSSVLRRKSNLGVLYVSGNLDLLTSIDDQEGGCLPKPYSASSVVMALEIVGRRSSHQAIAPIFPAGFRLLGT
jgi:DNA-binding response OmpR family regulator